MSKEYENPDDIWKDDLLKRREEAAMFIAYIESLARRRELREDKKAYSIAIDCPYGEGKTYFLKRLSRNLAINHPVAFVDAWVDDIADQPFTALAATLMRAMQPAMKDSQTIQSKWNVVLEKAGKIAWITGKGA